MGPEFISCRKDKASYGAHGPMGYRSQSSNLAIARHMVAFVSTRSLEHPSVNVATAPDVFDSYSTTILHAMPTSH